MRASRSAMRLSRLESSTREGGPLRQAIRFDRAGHGNIPPVQRPARNRGFSRSVWPHTCTAKPTFQHRLEKTGNMAECVLNGYQVSSLSGIAQ